jgi:hypothetical protein
LANATLFVRLGLRIPVLPVHTLTPTSPNVS